MLAHWIIVVKFSEKFFHSISFFVHHQSGNEEGKRQKGIQGASYDVTWPELLRARSNLLVTEKRVPSTWSGVHGQCRTWINSTSPSLLVQHLILRNRPPLSNTRISVLQLTLKSAQISISTTPMIASQFPPTIPSKNYCIKQTLISLGLTTKSRIQKVFYP